MLAPIGLANLAPPPGVAFLDLWLLHRMQLETVRCKGFDSLIIFELGVFARSVTGGFSMGLAARPLMLLP